jgi:AraC-like DNA-binding protein
VSRVGRIRVRWAFEVVALCQRAALQAETPDLGAFVDAFELLASRLPVPIGAAERVFLTDRLREITGRATRHLNVQLGNGQLRVIEPEQSWPSGPILEDPRLVLLEWLRRSMAGLRTTAHLPPGVRAALHVHSTSDSSLNLDGLAASVDCSRSVLTRNFRKVNGLSVGKYHRRVRLRKAIVLLSTTDWAVDSIARLVGYRSTNNLYVALRSLTCLTPSAIRRAKAGVISELLDDLFVPGSQPKHRRNSLAVTSKTPRPDTATGPAITVAANRFRIT